jgi:hypothetical protein
MGRKNGTELQIEGKMARAMNNWKNILNRLVRKEHQYPSDYDSVRSLSVCPRVPVSSSVVVYCGCFSCVMSHVSWASQVGNLATEGETLAVGYRSGGCEMRRALGHGHGVVITPIHGHP